MTEAIVEWADRLAGLLEQNPTVESFTVEFKSGVQLEVDEDGSWLAAPGLEPVALDDALGQEVFEAVG